MVAVESRQRQPVNADIAHPEEALSILMAVGGAIAGGITLAVPGCIVGAYLIVQILFLLVSATQIRALGVVDSIIAFVSVVAGAVLMIGCCSAACRYRCSN